jgi:hypothetical protein
MGREKAVEVPVELGCSIERKTRSPNRCLASARRYDVARFFAVDVRMRRSPPSAATALSIYGMAIPDDLGLVIAAASRPHGRR